MLQNVNNFPLLAILANILKLFWIFLSVQKHAKTHAKGFFTRYIKELLQS